MPIVIVGIGFGLAERTEDHGNGLSLQYIAGAIIVSTALIGGAAFVARRTAITEPPT